MKNYWIGQSSYGCKYRIHWDSDNSGVVDLSFWHRVQLFFGAKLVIVHHYKK